MPGRARTAQGLPEAQALAKLETAAAVVRGTAAGRRRWWGEPGCRGSVKRGGFSRSRCADYHQRATPRKCIIAPLALTNPQNEKAAEKFTDGNALELVAYQTGAIVSREIVKKKTGTVTVFAFDKARGLSEHTAPFDALVQVLDGVAEITVGGVHHSLGKDDMILMPANVPHALKAVERFKMILVMIRDAAAAP